MDLLSFKNSLFLSRPPDDLSPYLKSLWHDAKGEWEMAHTLIQDRPDKNAAWIHAYLHRKEGDSWNADYWYNKAGRKRPSVTLDDEWEAIVGSFL